VRVAGYWLIYVTTRSVLAVMQALPWSCARSIAGWFGDMGYLVDRRQRKPEALQNLLKAFPGLELHEARGILRGVYRHLSESIFDSLNFSRFAGSWDTEDLLEIVGWDRVEPIVGRNGVIFATGHFGHWEILGAALPLLGHRIWTMAQARKNPFFEQYVRHLREASGQAVLPKHGALRRIIRLLRRGENVGFVMDQDARRDGIFVDFFGRPASTTPAVASLSIRTGCPVAFVCAQRIPRQNRFRLVLTDVIFPDREADTQEEIHRITQRLTRDLEAVIRRAPEQWLWLHRRWKTYPGKYDAAQG